MFKNLVYPFKSAVSPVRYVGSLLLRKLFLMCLVSC